MVKGLKRYGTLVLLIALISCNEEEEIQKWVGKAQNLRLKAEEELPHTPYKNPQYQAFKDYFSELNKMLLDLGSNEKFIKPFNVVVSKSDLADLCPKIFISKDKWDLMMERCRRNRFFLCPEEVRVYPALVSGFRSYLDASQQRRFDETSTCYEMIAP